MSASRKTVPRLGRHTALCAALLALYTPHSSAVSLGPASVTSHLGQALTLSIPVQVRDDEAIGAHCFSVVVPKVADDLPYLLGARFQLEGEGAQRHLRLTSSQINREPVIKLLLRIACGADLQREYVLLVDPPKTQTTTTATNKILAEDAASPVADQALAKANAISPNLPDTAANAAVPASAKAAPARPPKGRSTAKKAAKNTSSGAAAADNRRLQISTGGTDSLQLATSIADRNELSSAERDALKQELALIGSLDERIATQHQLSEKLRQLEALQTKLQEDSLRLELAIRAQEERSQAQQQRSLIPVFGSADKSEAVKSLFSVTALAWLIGLASTLALGLFWLRQRRAAKPGELKPASTGSEPATQDGDVLAEPLTEADIWPEFESPNHHKKEKKQTPIGHSLGPASLFNLGPPSLLELDESAAEHESAVELADVMMSFGRVDGAAQTLAQYIRANPKQAVKPWIKLLEVYKAGKMRVEFDALSTQLNHTFNVMPAAWDEFEIARAAPESIESMTHVMDNIIATWGTRACQAYLHTLLRDNRDGTRQGFPLALIEEILTLLGILELNLGPYRHDHAAPSGNLGHSIMPAESKAHAAQVDTELPTQVSPAEKAPTPQANKNPSTSTIAASDKVGIATQPFAGASSLDFAFDMEAMTRTLHINLDELGDDDPHSGADESDATKKKPG